MKRIAVVNGMIDHNLDEYICAGLFTFIIEEFGKLIILTKCPRRSNNTREVNYAGQFTEHEVKFATALDYLQENGFEEAYLLNNAGDFDPKSFSWKGFIIGQLVDFDARLSLFYSDLERNTTGKIIVSKIPYIDKAFLGTAARTFQKAMDGFSLP